MGTSSNIAGAVTHNNLSSALPNNHYRIDADAKRHRSVIYLFFLFLIVLVQPALIYAAQSTITESEGYACMGLDKSRRQTEQQALVEAKRHAVEKTLSYFKQSLLVQSARLNQQRGSQRRQS